MHRPIPFGLVFLLPCIPAPAADAPPVAATVESTLVTADGNIRQFAFDGDPDTFFASEHDAGPTDHLTLAFERPVAVRSIAVRTGRPDGVDRLDAGTLEVSADGTTFDKLASFADGSAQADGIGREVRALRITPGEGGSRPLVVREIAIESEPPLTTFKYPVEFTVDVTDAPELKEWAEKVARACERSYPMINEELQSDGYRPPQQVTMTLKTSYRGVAAAGGTRIVGSVAYFKAHPDDVGAMIHETAHVVQHYRSRNNPSWLVEGVADYIRFFKAEPGTAGRLDPRRARYNASYRVSAAFLAFLAENYDAEIVLKLNARMRQGRYTADVFDELTGKSLQELDEDWRESLAR